MAQDIDSVNLLIRREIEALIAAPLIRAYMEAFGREAALEDFDVLLGCGRDYALMGGFNPNIKFTRTRTIMEGAEYCDFRFEAKD